MIFRYRQQSFYAIFTEIYSFQLKNETVKFDLDLSCQQFDFSCKSIIFKKATPQTESSEAHSFLFNYRNYLCNKLRLIFVLRRTFKIKVTECTRKRYIIFLRIGKKSFSGNGNILVSSMVKERYCFELWNLLYIFVFAFGRYGNTISNLLGIAYGILGKIHTPRCVRSIFTHRFKSSITQQIGFVSNRNGIVCTNVV